MARILGKALMAQLDALQASAHCMEDAPVRGGQACLCGVGCSSNCSNGCVGSCVTMCTGGCYQNCYNSCYRSSQNGR